MNSTSSNNSITTTTVELWFIPLDIFGITCLALAIVLTIIFIVIILVDKKCHTVRMMLVANIFLTGFICTTAHFIINTFTLYNDLNYIQYQDSFCVFRGYSSYASLALHIYSYLLSAIYQYVSIVYPTRLFWKSARVYICFIVISWIVAFVCPLPFTLTDQIIYNVDNQICQVPFRFSVTILYIPLFLFLVPVNLIMFIYMKLVRYVKEMNKRVTLGNTIIRAQRDLNMVRRIVILVHILLIAGFPLTLFIFLSFANLAPKYHFRIGFIFVYVSLLVAALALFQFTDLLKAFVRKLLYVRPHVVVPLTTIKPIILFENKTVEKRISGSVHDQDVEAQKFRRITVLAPK